MDKSISFVGWQFAHHRADSVYSSDIMHRNAYAVLIKEANRLNMFDDSRFCKDVLRIITVIA
jgi:hypothetical protein